MQVNLTSTEELLKNANAEIATLKALHATELDGKMAEIESLNSEKELLRAQLDVYRTDFESERSSRQDMANEREEILSDLKLLQRRNQQLIEESQARYVKYGNILIYLLNFFFFFIKNISDKIGNWQNRQHQKLVVLLQQLMVQLQRR